ncbi:binding-protein-dependent transport systems inner membrane component [Paenibacillus curdlanolyticus YK9]|uniref:Binding-protein-dependent transport systems inner membrane component n=1 Tax=Paenibacillus curdlanolyticus YK9 TaxID=717606 RepID=E0I9N4_9BACL|nr:carbohydrate ABC transporter permease [Paenibacillus curdlanolyticus]EFM11118.1 binding-protein-dependent transport systems inner membrane component [Paenibacillus curdlanolyticus YK9]
MYHKTLGYRTFSIINNSMLLLLAIVCILPLWNVLAISFSGKAPAEAGLVTLWPIDFNMEAYKATFNNGIFLDSLVLTIERTVLGVGISMLLMIPAAFALSKEYDYFKGRRVLIWLFVVTMLFPPGLIPGYILVSKLHLMHTIWALVLPTAVSAFNLILMLNFFKSIPKEIEESAFMDGANHTQSLWHIYLPLSLPSLATTILLALVGHWNSWFDGLLYMKSGHYPLATLLQTLITSRDLSQLVDSTTLKSFSPRTLSSAQIFLGVLPVLLIYPFLQKFFIKGIVVGAVKE